MRTLRLLLPLFLPLGATELARWTASSGQGISLVKAPDSAWMVQSGAAELTPVLDYYRRASFLLRVDAAANGPVWIDLEYLDRGYGLISLSHGPEASRGVSDSDQRGVVRLNTGKIRHAVFRIEKPSFNHAIAPGADLRIQGLPNLRSATIADTEPPVDPVPNVKPAVSLTRPIQLVISSGADANTVDGVNQSLATMRNLLPLAKAMGFNGIESYVKWNFVERSPGVFDWSFYDALLDELDKHDLRWFPLLIVGSAYALPEWFFKSPDMVGFKCLEHGTEIEIPTIFSNHQVKYVQKFLSEFGKHYGGRKTLLGVRLGPSANYGEAQYPATGAWGYPGRGLHTHLGYWAADEYAAQSFRGWLRGRYPGVAQLNDAWKTSYRSYDEVRPFLPATALTPRMRADFSNWYMDAMNAAS